MLPVLQRPYLITNLITWRTRSECTNSTLRTRIWHLAVSRQTTFSTGIRTGVAYLRTTHPISQLLKIDFTYRGTFPNPSSCIGPATGPQQIELASAKEPWSWINTCPLTRLGNRAIPRPLWSQMKRLGSKTIMSHKAIARRTELTSRTISGAWMIELHRSYMRVWSTIWVRLREETLLELLILISKLIALCAQPNVRCTLALKETNWW